MDATALTDLMTRDGYDALACLFWALKSDTPWRTECGQAAVERRRTDLLQALRDEVVPPLQDDDGLALLAALDQYLAEQRIGAAPLTTLVDEHDPPLWVAPRPPGWRPAISGPDQIARWMRHHAVGPQRHGGIEVRVTAAPTRLVREWSSRDAVMVAGFSDDTTPLNDAEEGEFHSRGLVAAHMRETSLQSLMSVLSDNSLCALVLPELTLPEAMRDAWLGQLIDSGHAPLLTVAGTYHQLIDGKRRNVAVLTDAHGVTLLQQWKVQPFTVDSMREVIAGGHVVELLSGPWGTLAIAICRDFCEHNNEALWETLNPDLILVPSMGNPATLSAHSRRAKHLSLAADTLVCIANQPVGFDDQPLIHGFIFGRGIDSSVDSKEELKHIRFCVETIPSRLKQD